MYYCIIYIIAAIIMAGKKEDRDADVDVDVGLDVTIIAAIIMAGNNEDLDADVDVDVGLDVGLDVDSDVNLYIDSSLGSTLGIFLTPKQRSTQCTTSRSCRQRRMGQCCCSYDPIPQCISTRSMCTRAGFRCL